MTMTEDQIIAEAKRLAIAEGNPFTREDFYFAESVARHALRLATQPEQDPALVKAMAVWMEAYEVWDGKFSATGDGEDLAALIIMKHYPAPSEQLIGWAIGALSTPNTFVGQRDAARYILTMAGEKQ